MGLWNKRFPKKDPVWCCKEVPNSRNPPPVPQINPAAPAPASRGNCSRPRCGWNEKRDRFRWWLQTWQGTTLRPARPWGFSGHGGSLTIGPWLFQLSHGLTEMIGGFWGYLHDLGNLRNKQNRSRKGSGWGRLAKSPSSSAGGARIIWPSGNLT